MKTVFLVTEEEADTARRMESKLLKLPLSSGVLFAGVSVVPARPGEQPIYRIWIGCHRSLEEKLIESVVRHTLRDEIQCGIILKVEAHRGISRAPLQEVVDS